MLGVLLFAVCLFSNSINLSLHFIVIANTPTLQQNQNPQFEDEDEGVVSFERDVCAVCVRL
jgi:hypothetical protein